MYELIIHGYFLTIGRLSYKLLAYRLWRRIRLAFLRYSQSFYQKGIQKSYTTDFYNRKARHNRIEAEFLLFGFMTSRP